MPPVLHCRNPCICHRFAAFGVRRAFTPLLPSFLLSGQITDLRALWGCQTLDSWSSEVCRKFLPFNVMGLTSMRPSGRLKFTMAPNRPAPLLLPPHFDGCGPTISRAASPAVSPFSLCLRMLRGETIPFAQKAGRASDLLVGRAFRLLVISVTCEMAQGPIIRSIPAVSRSP